MAQLLNVTNIKKAYYYCKRNGTKAAIGAALERVTHPYYADYTYILPTEEELKRQKETKWEQPITFSIVVPTYETKPEFLHSLVESLRQQSYANWELILADASIGNQVKVEAEKYQDERIRYVTLPSNEGISENTNRGLQEVRGDYVGLLDHDDFLTPDALYQVAKAIEEGKKKDITYPLLYSDEDKCDADGTTFYDPHFKTDFNLDLFFTNNYICHFLVMKREFIQSLRFRSEYDGAQDYDICLRAIHCLWEQYPAVEEQICHIPRVLYHWRCHNDSTAANPQSKQYAYEAGKKALDDFIRKRGWKAHAESMAHVGFYRIVYENGIFENRNDIAAIGGKEIKKGKIKGSIYDQEGTPLYENLPEIYSGYIHRAVLAQDAKQLDIEKWKVNPKRKQEIETFYQEKQSKGYKTKKQIQKSLCEYLCQQGYRLYWDPEWKL